MEEGLEVKLAYYKHFEPSMQMRTYGWLNESEPTYRIGARDAILAGPVSMRVLCGTGNGTQIRRQHRIRTTIFPIGRERTMSKEFLNVSWGRGLRTR